MFASESYASEWERNIGRCNILVSVGPITSIKCVESFTSLVLCSQPEESKENSATDAVTGR
jgi:hypothetical protein